MNKLTIFLFLMCNKTNNCIKSIQLLISSMAVHTSKENNYFYFKISPKKICPVAVTLLYSFSKIVFKEKGLVLKKKLFEFNYEI